MSLFLDSPVPGSNLGPGPVLSTGRSKRAADRSVSTVQINKIKILGKGLQKKKYCVLLRSLYCCCSVLQKKICMTYWQGDSRKRLGIRDE